MGDALVVRNEVSRETSAAGKPWKCRGMESLESQNAGFPPFPLLLEIPSGFPHFQRFGDVIIFKAKTPNELFVGRKGLVTDVSGPQRNACPGTLTP